MRQTNEAIDKLETEKAYSGSRNDFKILRTLRTIHPQQGISNEAFSEVFIRFEGQTQVCRLYADRKLQLILTTKPAEKAIRERYMQQGMSLVEAIDRMYTDELESIGKKTLEYS